MFVESRLKRLQRRVRLVLSRVAYFGRSRAEYLETNRSDKLEDGEWSSECCAVEREGEDQTSDCMTISRRLMRCACPLQRGARAQPSPARAQALPMTDVAWPSVQNT